jgi:hypothetical protein
MTAATRLSRLNAKALGRFGASHQINGAPVQGWFVQPGKTFTLSDGIGIAARVPTLVVADGDVPVNPVGLGAVCENQAYTVQDVTPDGLGLAVIELEKVAA